MPEKFDVAARFKEVAKRAEEEKKKKKQINVAPKTLNFVGTGSPRNKDVNLPFPDPGRKK